MSKFGATPQSNYDLPIPTSLTSVSPSTIPIDSIVDKVTGAGVHLLPDRFAVGIHYEADCYEVTFIALTFVIHDAHLHRRILQYTQTPAAVPRTRLVQHISDGFRERISCCLPILATRRRAEAGRHGAATHELVFSAPFVHAARLREQRAASRVREHAQVLATHARRTSPTR